MQVNVAQLLKEPIGATRNYKVSEMVDIAGATGGKKVQGEIRLVRTQQGIMVRGALHTEVELTCSRCLNLFSYSATINIDEEYAPTIDVVSGIPLPPPEEPGTFLINEQHIIDLTEAIRQYLLLAIPMKPLCREDCAGLCQHCGRNLNQGPCHCSPQGIDPRWSALSKLL
jgi:uncharacterized protein